MSVFNLKNVALLGAALVLGACANTTQPVPNIQAKPAVITIDRKTDQIALSYGGGHSGLSRKALNRLENFLRTFSQDRPHSTHLVIVVPGGKPRSDIGKVLQNVRIPADNGVWLPSPGRTARKILVKAELYTAIPPVCRKRTIIGAPLNDNRGDVDIGCSNIANLARSVADAKDLVGRDFTVLSNGVRASGAVRTRNAAASGAPAAN